MATVRLAVLLAVAALLSTESLAVSHRRPFRSIKAPKETVTNYETVTPVVTHRDTRGDSRLAHPRNLHVHVPARDANYSLVLELNEVILSGGFTSRHYDEEGQEVVTKGHVNCFYQGRVEDHPDWRVTMSTCHGLQGSFGDMNDESKFFHLEPLSIESSSMEQQHAFYLDSEYKQKQGSCGTDHSHALNEPLHGTEMDVLKHSKHSRLRRQSTTRYVEWAVVNDNRQYIANGRNLSATVLRAISLANAIDGLYRSLQIRVVLTNAVTWTDRDRFTINPDPSTLLDTFRSQQRNVISSTYDNAMLITGIDLTGSTVGIAFVGTMCSSTSSVGVTQDGGRSLSSVASTAAHEMGHNFNMNHDDTTRSCNCVDGNQGCIMAAISGFPPPTRWSSCSVSDLNTGFSRSNRNTGTCLTNIPTTMVGDPVCGNGIREGNEICDCGSPQECTDPCCNAATCQLASGAQCSAGPCCTSTCQFSSYGTQCRASTGSCDIAEYCPGDSADCPADDHRVNGISCNSNTGYCFDGTCPTHNAQCQTAFGSNRGADRCYTITNVRGDQFGNCGHTTSAFIPCNSANVMCGQLQCQSGDFQLRNLPVTTLTFTIGSDVCRSFTTQPDPSMDIESPGLVEDGTRCGTNRICQSQRCVSLPTTTQCSPDPNCGGNGVCNNGGTCSCNVGFTGTSCETPFNGPGGVVNECSTNNGGCDQICTDTQDSFVCSCNSGYTLSSNGRTCVDNNECTAGTHNCQQVCVNINGGFRCQCNSGFQLNSDQRTCSDINECSSNNGGCNQLCTNTAGSFTCSCRTGFTLGSNGRTCVDNNECATNNGGCAQTCTNTAGSFQCSCRNGFVLAGNQRTCNDVNECASNNGGCDQVCTNTAGSFQCSCNSGFTPSNNGRTCTDINECTLGTDNCQQRCINTNGGFRCDCDTGYTLDSNQATCSSDINECTSNNGGCQQICRNTGGTFTCACFNGYLLGSDGRSCNDINECNVNNGGCNQVCRNNDGSFTCSCNRGFVLSENQRTCVAINPCVEGRNNCDQLCSATNDGIPICSCEAGYVLDADGSSCNDINECSSNNGGCAETCQNMDGSFECSCMDGFQLAADKLNCSTSTIASVNGTSESGPGTGSSGSQTVGAIVGGVVGGILLLVVVIIVIIMVAVVAMKASKKDIKPYKGYKPGYSTSGNGLHHTPSTTRMLSTSNEVTVDIGDGNHNIGDDSTNSFSFFPTPPISPPAAYKPPPPSYHDVTRNPDPIAPKHNVPTKPQPASKLSPAPKPTPLSTTGVANAPAPKPTPKPKPPVTTEKPKPAVRPSPALKPSPASQSPSSKPLLPTSTAGPTTAKKPLATPTKNQYSLLPGNEQWTV